MPVTILRARPLPRRHAVDDVELPQLHRLLAFPPLVAAFVLLRMGVNESVVDQYPVYRGPRRSRCHAEAAEFETDSPGTPTRMRPTHLTYLRLHARGQPCRAATRTP